MADSSVGNVEVAGNSVLTSVHDTLPGAGVGTPVKVKGVVDDREKTTLKHTLGSSLASIVCSNDGNRDRWQEGWPSVTRIDRVQSGQGSVVVVGELVASEYRERLRDGKAGSGGRCRRSANRASRGSGASGGCNLSRDGCYD